MDAGILPLPAWPFRGAVPPGVEVGSEATDSEQPATHKSAIAEARIADLKTRSLPTSLWSCR